MTAEERRRQILSLLKDSKEPITATALANMYSVTRQIIVADIALLRASGEKIRAEHRGYVFDNGDDGDLKYKIVCQHSKEGALEELYAIVDNGGCAVDVMVEHSIYGTISAGLNISSRYDVDRFIEDVSKAGASQLADLTDGIHIHTVSVESEDAFERIVKRLKELNILIEK
jgi:transcriptional regulator of NAD metabolism